MKKQKVLTGYLFLLAALTFWASWYLMPDPGTVDTAHILEIVKASRMNVLASVLIQITSTVLFITGLFTLAQISSRQRLITLAGTILLGIGMLGMCSDAFFHLLAYFMTDNAVVIQQDVVKVMDFMQTTGVVVLLPILLPFFIGGLLLTIGLRQQELISKTPGYFHIAAFVVGIVGGIISNTILPLKGQGFMLTVLGLFAAGHASLGVELIRNKVFGTKN